MMGTKVRAFAPLCNAAGRGAGGSRAGRGTKVRAFAPLCNRSLEDLVPADHFYRHLEAKLDLGFVRDLVRDTYKGGGRPSVDPTVFFKTH